MKTILQLLTICFALRSHASYPVVLYQHNGNVDPSIEGWSVAISGSTAAGPVVDGSTPAWSIANNTPSEFGFYSLTPSAANTLAAATLGWSLQTSLRVTNTSLAPGGSMLSLYRDGTRSFQMHFGAAANGDAIVVLADNSGFDSSTGASYTVPGGSVYNTFELRYSPGSGTADLFVNGSLALVGYAGFALSQNLLAWGDGSTRDLSPRVNTSAGNYSESVFSIVPEPTATTLWFAGSVVLLGVRRSFRRQHQG